MIKVSVVMFFVSGLAVVQVCEAGALKANKVESLKLDPKVDASDQAYFGGLESIAERNKDNSTGRLGALALPFMYVEKGDPGRTLTEFLKAQEIDVPKIVLAELESRLKAGPLAAKLSDSSENTLKLSLSYGLSKGSGTDKVMRPGLNARLTLVDGTGKELGESKANVGGADFSLPYKSLHEWMAEPAAMQAAYEQAAKLLAKKLLPSPPKKKKSQA